MIYLARFSLMLSAVLLLILPSLCAQDSLLIQYQQSKQLTEKLPLLEKLIGRELRKAPQQAIVYAYQLDSLAALQDDPLWHGKGLHNLGIAHYFASDYVEATAFYLEALPIWESIPDSAYIGKTYLNLGACFEKRGKDEATIQYFLKAQSYFNPKKDSLLIAMTFNNIANRLSALNKLDSAAYFYQQTINLAKALKRNNIVASAQGNLATLYVKQNRHQDAAIAHQAALDLSDPNRNPEYYYKVLGNLAQTEIVLGKLSASKRKIDSVLAVAKRLQLAERERQGLGLLGEWYEANGQYKKAYETFRIYLDLRDSIFFQQQDAQMVELLTKYETEKKESKIQLLESQNKIQDLQLQQAARERNYFYLGLLALAIVAGLSYYSYQLTRRSSAALEEKNKVISKSLAEKEILLKEIHHRVKNNLQMVSSLLSLQSRRLDDEKSKEAIRESQNRVKAMALIHQHLYMGDNFTGVNAKAYIDRLSRHLFDSYNIHPDKIKLETHIDDIKVDIDTIIPFGLIINELVTNALKYAFEGVDQGKVEVRLQQTADQQLQLEVQDNGSGLPKDFQYEQATSFGFKMVQAFAKKMNATLEVQQQQGTQVSLRTSNIRLSN
ncbi:MAG: tetratricopeptide repeat protein [Saprospiraceae bacterium]|nr:tetratricopeptide repeat protein [Saprospiraceae bacterium]